MTHYNDASVGLDRFTAEMTPKSPDPDPWPPPLPPSHTVSPSKRIISRMSRCICSWNCSLSNNNHNENQKKKKEKKSESENDDYTE